MPFIGLEHHRIEVSGRCRPVVLALVSGAICAAGDQLLFAIGARGRTWVLSFVNIWIISGCACYAVGTVFWIYSLSRAQLIQVYPFTVLTFALIYLSAIVMLGERPCLVGLEGVTLVLAGLFMLSLSR